jgi:hypothetical protein
MFMAVPLGAKYHIESLGHVPTPVGLTSVAITLLHLHLAQILSGCRAVKIWRYSVGLPSYGATIRQTSLEKYSSSWDIYTANQPLESSQPTSPTLQTINLYNNNNSDMSAPGEFTPTASKNFVL